MDLIWEAIVRGAEQLLGRASGPMHIRLIIQSTVAAVLAIRAGLRDARAGNPAFLWTVFTSTAERSALIRSGWKDIGQLFMFALVLDTIYQAIALRTFYPLQALEVATCLAIVPYSLIRGPAARIYRRFFYKQNAT